MEFTNFISQKIWGTPNWAYSSRVVNKNRCMKITAYEIQKIVLKIWQCSTPPEFFNIHQILPTILSPSQSRHKYTHYNNNNTYNTKIHLWLIDLFACLFNGIWNGLRDVFVGGRGTLDGAVVICRTLPLLIHCPPYLWRLSTLLDTQRSI